jgi:hypothetical protein
MEAACSSEILLQTTRYHNPENRNLNNHRRGNLRSCIFSTSVPSMDKTTELHSLHNMQGKFRELIINTA